MGYDSWAAALVTTFGRHRRWGRSAFSRSCPAGGVGPGRFKESADGVRAGWLCGCGRSGHRRGGTLDGFRRMSSERALRAGRGLYPMPYRARRSAGLKAWAGLGRWVSGWPLPATRPGKRCRVRRLMPAIAQAWCSQGSGGTVSVPTRVRTRRIARCPVGRLNVGNNGREARTG
jgi:hypothetical protein